MIPDELLSLMVSRKPGFWTEFLAICTLSGSKLHNFAAFDLEMEQQEQGRHLHHKVTYHPAYHANSFCYQVMSVGGLCK